jgi:hypothetical protein
MSLPTLTPPLPPFLIAGRMGDHTRSYLCPIAPTMAPSCSEERGGSG